MATDAPKSSKLRALRKLAVTTVPLLCVTVGACDWLRTPADDTAPLILDIEPEDNSGGTQFLHVEIHGPSYSHYCLGVRTTIGTFDGPTKNGLSSDCVNVDLSVATDDAGRTLQNHDYLAVLRVASPPTDPVFFATLFANPDAGSCAAFSPPDASTEVSGCSGSWLKVAAWPSKGSTAPPDATADGAPPETDAAVDGPVDAQGGD